MNDNLIKLPYNKIRSLLINKDISAHELVMSYLAQAKVINPKCNMYREITEEYAINQAKKSQKRINSGKALKIEAMPIAIKDNYCTKGILTTACSEILENFIPPYESTVTSRIFANGGIMLGKTNMDEFGMGSSNTNSHFGDVINPYRANLVAGGSSGGSAVAVAVNSCLAALGTDTGGSVRLPAAFTGTIGVKPTYGRCSRYGIIAFSSSFDQAGVFANNLLDAGLILESIMGFDENDSTSKYVNEEPMIIEDMNKNIKGTKVGVIREYEKKDISPDIRYHLDKSKKWLQEAGAELVEISLPNIDHALATYYIITSAESSSNLARYDGVRYGKRIEIEGDNFQEMIARTRGECFGKEVKRRIIAGTYVLCNNNIKSYYQKAQKVRRLIFEDFQKSFKKVDVILTPTSSTTAFALNEKLDPIKMYNNDLFTVPASLAGLPCISMPVGLSKKSRLPVAIQMIAKSYDENTLFRFANVIEKSANFHHAHSFNL